MSQAAVVAPQPTIDFRWHTYGKWLAMGPSEELGKEAFRACRCECGTDAEIHYLALVEGRARSCGCDVYRHKGSKLKDITGQQFGQYLVLRRGTNSNTGRIRWQCRCACGRDQLVQGASLRNRDFPRCKKCGQAKELSQRWIYGRFNVGRSGSNRHRAATWRMQCICGRKTRDIRGSSLRRGVAKTCSCRLSWPMIGKYFGFLYVLTPSKERRHGRLAWQCQCVCGFTEDFAHNALMRGTSRSCGCRGKTLEIGQIIGRLTVIASEGRGRWRCLCICSHECILRGADLRSGRSKSCGMCLYTDQTYAKNAIPVGVGA